MEIDLILMLPTSRSDYDSTILTRELCSLEVGNNMDRPNGTDIQVVDHESIMAQHVPVNQVMLTR